MSILVPTLIITVLILANAFFVAAEFAIVAVPRPVIQRRAAAGGRRAARVERILDDARRQDQFVATAQLGITVASLGLGMYGEHVLARAFEGFVAGLPLPSWVGQHALASVAAIGLLTYFHIVIGEMVPKAISLSRAEAAALWLTPIMAVIQTICYPIIFALNGIGNGLLRLFGVRRTSTGEHYYSQEELQYVVRESEEGGLLPTEQAQVLDELLEFGELTAREAMVPRVRIRGLRLGAALEEVVALVLEETHTRYPVHAGDLDHIVGTIHIKDILRRFREGRRILQADVHPIPFVPETMTLDEVFRIMRDRRAQMVVVMDEHGGTGGILTIEDLFEEIIGDIDESQEQPEIAEENGALLVLGTVRLEEIGERFDMSLEHEDVDSVSGLVLGLLGRPPRIGDRVEWKEFGFEVLEVEGHGVGRVRVTQSAPPASAAADE